MIDINEKSHWGGGGGGGGSGSHETLRLSLPSLNLRKARSQ